MNSSNEKDQKFKGKSQGDIKRKSSSRMKYRGVFNEKLSREISYCNKMWQTQRGYTEKVGQVGRSD